MTRYCPLLQRRWRLVGLINSKGMHTKNLEENMHARHQNLRNFYRSTLLHYTEQLLFSQGNEDTVVIRRGLILDANGSSRQGLNDLK